MLQLFQRPRSAYTNAGVLGPLRAPRAPRPLGGGLRALDAPESWGASSPSKTLQASRCGGFSPPSRSPASKRSSHHSDDPLQARGRLLGCLGGGSPQGFRGCGERSPVGVRGFREAPRDAGGLGWAQRPQRPRRPCAPGAWPIAQQCAIGSTFFGIRTQTLRPKTEFSGGPGDRSTQDLRRPQGAAADACMQAGSTPGAPGG